MLDSRRTCGRHGWLVPSSSADHVTASWEVPKPDQPAPFSSRQTYPRTAGDQRITLELWVGPVSGRPDIWWTVLLALTVVTPLLLCHLYWCTFSVLATSVYAMCASVGCCAHIVGWGRRETHRGSAICHNLWAWPLVQTLARGNL